MNVNSRHVHGLNIKINWIFSFIFLTILLSSLFQIQAMAALQLVELAEEEECSSSAPFKFFVFEFLRTTCTSVPQQKADLVMIHSVRIQ